ncbi:Epo1p KNAG_0E02240 [Huiozyma naganishii CBS 8797]|uniref:Uncharacterized protein n=1 Tax=Huiozyma naganishii (strain ATCC MYA-139 / BCRC 22969 / CBS 8797 / KCTC 17520 / NBRC 10181 / NCYC 3082 / Yp74L-3) TaxID=1071383 RepID=J7R6M3_HUIN7|nr:hypothetical protein KNAG_0E02240 [Kazachstania naganishii CBS 8797]CCK70485.1 hypothetical protein KNAG_0E02240 [Kazachstania naganishii CBS 8797]
MQPHHSDRYNLRSNLLQSDVGNIDITKETPINGPAPVQQQQQQQQPQQYYPQQQMPPQQYRNYPQQQQFYPRNGNSMYMNQQQQYGTNNGSISNFGSPPPKPKYVSHQQKQPDRKSYSLTQKSISNFFKPKGNIFHKNKTGGGQGDFDDDDDDLEIDEDTSQASLSFNDIQKIGFKNGDKLNVTSDSTPLIPTLMTKERNSKSNTEYRKYLNTQKKSALNAMAQQSPVQGPQVQGPRTMSLQSGPPTRSFATLGNPDFATGVNGPRTNSLMTTGLPPMNYLQQQQQLQQQRHSQQTQQQPSPVGYGPPLQQKTMSMTDRRPNGMNMSPQLQQNPQQQYRPQQFPPQQFPPQQSRFDPSLSQQSFNGSGHNLGIYRPDASPHPQFASPPMSNGQQPMPSPTGNNINAPRLATQQSVIPNQQQPPPPSSFSPTLNARPQTHPSLSAYSNSNSSDSQFSNGNPEQNANGEGQGSTSSVNNSDPEPIRHVTSPLKNQVDTAPLNTIEIPELAVPPPVEKPKLNVLKLSKPQQEEIKSNAEDEVKMLKELGRSSLVANSLASMNLESSSNGRQSTFSDSPEKLKLLQQKSGLYQLEETTDSKIFVTAEEFPDDDAGSPVRKSQIRRSVVEPASNRISIHRSGDNITNLKHESSHSLVTKATVGTNKSSNTVVPKQNNRGSTDTKFKEHEKDDSFVFESMDRPYEDNAGIERRQIVISADQLNIIAQNRRLMDELTLVSTELAESIRRETLLFEKLKQRELSGEEERNESRVSSMSSSLSLDDFEVEMRKKSAKIVELIQSLNDERQKRFIAEEQVLLQENGVKPNSLELMQKIKDLAYNNRRQEDEIASLKEAVNNDGR